MTEPGIYPNMSPREYHAVDAMSSHALAALAKSPRHFQLARSAGSSETPTFCFGTVFHRMVLEQDFSVSDEERKLLKRGRYSVEQLEDMVAATYLPEASVFRGLIEQSQREVSVFWSHTEYGFLCKARIDIMAPDARIIGDLKSTIDASLEAFKRQIVNYGYGLQAAWYLEGINNCQADVEYDRFLFLPVEKQPPHLVGVYDVTGFLDVARQRIDVLCELYQHCLDTNTWGGLPDQVVNLDPPKWYK